MSEHETYALLKFFDSDEDGLLSFQDFIQILLPCEDNKLRNQVVARPSHRVGRFEFLPRDIEMGLTAIIEKEICLQRRIEEAKRQLQSRYDYSPLLSFKSIDRYNIGRIDSLNLNVFLKANDFCLREIDLLAIIRRIDTNGDACLDFNEFLEFLKPLSKEVAMKGPPSRAINERRAYGYPRDGSPLRTGGSPHRTGPVPGPMPMPPNPATLFVTPPGTNKDRPVLRISDEDELITALREQCKLERELESFKISLV